MLVIDVGGSHVKLLATGADKVRKFASGRKLGPAKLVDQTKSLTADWDYDAVSIGYPGPVLHGVIVTEPFNLGKGWAGFDFAAAFERPVKIVNDAAMQALGGYQGGRMLFLGFGTGLGTAMIVDGVVEPMELGHLAYRKSTFEDYVGNRARKRIGNRKWRQHALDVIARLQAALEPDEVLIGGGNVKHFDELPPGCRRGSNDDAITGGIRLWNVPAAAQGSGH